MLKKIKSLFLSTNIESVLNYKHASFDIFDTLIKRKCGRPSVIFDLVEQKYNNLGKGVVRNYKKYRIESESILRNRQVEVSLDEIYNSLSNEYGERVSLLLKSLEIETELDQCVANKNLVEFYNSYVNTNGAFIISDMYLPMSVIEEILKKNGIFMPIKVYISCEYGKTKRNRLLYEQVVAEQRIRIYSCWRQLCK